MYGGEDGIAKHLGFKAARFTRLNDPRLNAAHGEGIGLSFATDRPIENSYDIDLGNRQGLGVVLGIGAYGLQIANVYLDDLSEDIRTKQIAALLFGLEKGLPTIITGDMNVLRQDMAGASVLTKMKDRGVRALAKTLPKKTEIGITIAEMNKRVAMKQILDAGYIDADSKLKRPTAPAVLPIFGIDYALHTGDVSIEEFDVIRIKGESDHRPIKFKATVE